MGLGLLLLVLLAGRNEAKVNPVEAAAVGFVEELALAKEEKPPPDED